MKLDTVVRRGLQLNSTVRHRSRTREPLDPRSTYKKVGAAAAPRPPLPAKQPPPSEEDIRQFVFDSLFDNRWDNDLRVRRISLTADAPSFKVKVPRTSRAGVNETLTGEQVAARLVSVMRSRAHRGKTMDEWRKEQLAWLLDPVRPAKKG